MSDNSSDFIIRPSIPDDVPMLFELIKALAEYEQLSHTVTGDAQTLKQHLFGTRPYAEAIVAECQKQVIGFALFFSNYSTFLTQPGIYLEDLFVLPEFRGRGIGKALITSVAELAVERNCGRLEWSVLNWNEAAIAFYQNLGASILPDWRICRVTENSLRILRKSL
ncbi:MAG: GNAT family N-acetyltransferase [Symploca sp. SIO2D2]|nr:GNAT family N-acetyltransferase [Symploca sp. SIO2D2]NER49277.1 GNAT family N-acetyltransferase [Symploca sp. SIO1A3]